MQGDTGSLEQAVGQIFSAGSLGWRWAASAESRVAGDSIPGTGCPTLSSQAPFCLLPGSVPPVSFGSEQCPSHKPQGREAASLGEVERFIPGEQAAGADATLPTGVAAVPVSTACGVGWARRAGPRATGELRDVRKVLRP